MKLGAALTLIGLGIGVATFAVATGCGDSSDSGSATSEVGKTVPEETGAPTSSTETRTFAVNRLYLGEADRAGTTSPDAWKKFGYNLDSLITNVTDRNSPALGRVCKLTTGAVASTHQDGEEGTDNSFGKNVLALIKTFNATPSNDVNDALAKGDFTIMLKTVGLTDDPAQTATGLSGTLLVGAKFSDQQGVVPTFSPADDWPYQAEPQVPLNGAYINNGVFVNGKGGSVVKLAIGIQGQNLNLTINKAFITFKHVPGSKSLDEGVIAGVINTEELTNGIKVMAGRISKDLCSGATLQGILDSLRQASDMLADGTQDPSKPCDGISIGLGFTAKQVGNPTKTAPPSTPEDDPCTASSGDQDAGSQQ